MAKVIPIVEDKIHTLLSPSSSERWIACPGSAHANASLAISEPEASNEAALLGTAAHKLLEHALFLDREPEKFIGKRLAPGHPKVDQKMVDAVEKAWLWVEEYLDDHGHENVQVHIERPLIIGPEFGIVAEMCSGTTDIQLEHKDYSMLVTADYKHGFGVVDAEENPQLMLYGAGGRHEAGRKFKRYMNVVIQPRAMKRRAVDQWEYTDAMLNKFLRELVKPSAQAAVMPNAPRVAGRHCKWCRAAPTCRTFMTRATAVAEVEFKPIIDKDPRDIPVEEYARILNEADILEDWIKRVKAHALKRIMAGDQIDGWELGFGKRTREWSEEGPLVDWLLEHSIPEDEYAPRELLSPAKMTTLIKSHKLIPRKQRGEKETPPNPLNAFIKYSIPKTVLVRSDSEFDAVESDDEEE